MSDPFLNTGIEVIFYVALGVLLIIWILKKRKQLHVIEENTSKEKDASDD